MNIIFFAGRIVYGGGERVRNWLALNLVKSGHSVTYAIPESNKEFNSELESVGLLYKINVVYYPSYLKNKKPLKYWRHIKGLFIENHTDLLIYFGGSLIEQLIARKLGIKVLLSERCDPHSRPVLSQVLKQIQYRNADAYVFQTPDAAKCYGKRARLYSSIIPNPILDDSPSPIYDNLRKEIVSVGRLSEEKNQLMLLKAFNIIKDEIPDYSLKIYGSGPMEEQLNDFIETNQLIKRVEIIKGKTNITELINGASLFVLPSNTEGMPNALIEAMSMGLLCISTDCPIYGPRFLVKDGFNAFLTPINDESKLADKILFSLNYEDAFRIRKEAVKIRETLNADVIFSKWLTYINKITVKNDK